MLYAGIDIHKSVFQAVVLEPDTGELCESRFEPSRERLGEWADDGTTIRCNPPSVAVLRIIEDVKAQNRSE